MFDDFDLFEQVEEFIPSGYEEDDGYDYGISSVIGACALIKTLQEIKKDTKSRQKIGLDIDHQSFIYLWRYN